MFVKFPSIENTYNAKNLAYWMRTAPEIFDYKYAVLEKLHGSNIQISADEHGKVEFGSRQQPIDPSANFFGLWNLLEEPIHQESDIPYSQVIDWLRSWTKSEGMILHLYGELFNSKNSKGIDYGDDPRIRFFAARINNDMLVSWELFLDILDNFLPIGVGQLLRVPLLGVTDSLQEALDFDIELSTNSVVGIPKPPESNPENLIEGIVITPFSKSPVVDKVGKTFILKKKNKWASEKSGKASKVKKKMRPEVVLFRHQFDEYINDNRVEAAISKVGQLTGPRDFGNIIPAVLADAREDFLKENELPDDLDSAEKKFIFNAGAEVAALLKARLEEA
jgi:Rnl2 family RNA ligase